ncbi:flotillin family protein [Anabaena cylindrica FACHB-243]|uniref:Band 7 protein n=1 Tax=Anabaena cylindrica (strain ATCC 27899 / PCC 7122) TaxID=272123 RepID=K9ZQ83_ANACC|nr:MULTISPECIES: SPFH domain-containing protein [Anabaena]AFZ60520.1 band 7 protein [Anabaena cylindrica PCC 7122]MBD2419021.1 flotillin family protein [Anabaena cylindrica FACHB-243]MBY5282915.1 flotillin family protein [Anabaena sp. CCAP 1446/1C]MBY5309978.1 flotillin family protein [Anabaena sp. CCAP 1446/1C]MCM2407210.1 SPFH domain-containing protein [Anabaena sp. CCAP 1446/1C]
MLFWLTFIQALPTVDVLEMPSVQLQSKQQQTTLINPTFPLTTQPSLAQINGGLVFPGVIVTLVLLLLLSLFAYTRVYVVTPNNEAFVRTGGLFTKKKAVILYGGCIVLPGFHQLTRVPLREISIDVERTGKMAVRTKDYLRADIRVTFYVCINASEDDVLTAAARLSQNGTKINPEDIKNALEKRADDAIRAAAKTKDLAEIDSDKLGFAQEVLNLVGTDLKKVGLTLNNIAISEILESVTYDPDNFFDAQGVRLRTEIIQRSVQQKREVELSAQVTIEQKELDAQKRSLQIAQEQESAKLSQKLQVEALKAQREREIQESKDREAATVQRTKILQAKSVEEEEIRKKLSLQQSQIEADITLEERNKQLKVAQSLQKQEAELAEIIRQQSVESGKLQAQVQIVESERLARIAQEDLAIAIANKKRESFVAQAEQAKAEESVKTASEVEKAERTKRLSIIAAEREAQERSISDRNIVEIDAFRRRRQAEIAQEAAELEAEAIRTLADANRDKALAEAEGIQAKIAAENTISNANLSAKMLTTIWPELADKLPEIVSALAPQPGVLGDTRIYSFPGANGTSGSQDINKLLLSTSGLSLINTLLDEGKLGDLIGQVSQMVRGNNSAITPTLNQQDTEIN